MASLSKSANVSTVTLTDGREVCLSYGVPVAAFIPGRGYIRTECRYSVTSSKHATQYCGFGLGARPETEVSDKEFRALIAPVTAKWRR